MLIMQVINCPKCGTPQFFDEAPVPASVSCVNQGFQLYATPESPAVPPCTAIYPTKDVRKVIAIRAFESS